MPEWLCDWTRGFSVLVSDLAIVLLTVGLIPILAGLAFSVNLQLWAAFLALQLSVSHYLIRREVSWSVYLVMSGFFAALSLGFIVRFMVCSAYREDMLVLVGVCALGLSSHCAFVAYRPPSANLLSGYVDFLIVLAAFWLYTIYATSAVVSGETTALASAALALDLLMVGHLRVRGENARVIQGAGAGSRLMLAGILFFCVFATGVVVGRGSGQVHSAVDVLLIVVRGCITVVSAIFSWLGYWLGRLILLLVLLLPAAPDSMRENAEQQLFQETEETAEYGSSLLPDWLFPAVFGILAVAFVCWGLYQLRGINIRSRKHLSVSRRVVKRSFFWKALLSGLAAIAGRLQLEWNYQCNRRTPEGLLILAERCGAGLHLPRRPSESPGAYLRRLADETTGTKLDSSSLTVLAELFDQHFYGPASLSLSTAEARSWAELLHGLRRLQAVRDGQ